MRRRVHLLLQAVPILPLVIVAVAAGLAAFFGPKVISGVFTTGTSTYALPGGCRIALVSYTEVGPGQIVFGLRNDAASDVTVTGLDDVDWYGNDDKQLRLVEEPAGGTTIYGGPNVDPPATITFTPDFVITGGGGTTTLGLTWETAGPGPDTPDEVYLTFATDQGTCIVTNYNDPPEAIDDSASTNRDTPVSIDVLANDDDPDFDDFWIESFDSPTVQGGTVTLDENGTTNIYDDDWLDYTPPPGFTGVDAFTYTLWDGWGGYDSATVMVTVQVPACQLTLVSDSIEPPDRRDFTIRNDAASAVTLTGVDPVTFDGGLTLEQIELPDGTPVTSSTGPSPYSAVFTTPYVLASGGTVVAEIEWNGALPTTVIITFTSDQGDCSVGINNSPPTAVNDTGISTPEDTPVVIDVAANDSDPDGNLDPSAVSVASPPGDGIALPGPGAGEITYVPDADYNGGDSFDYEICDTLGACDTATVTLTVDPANDPPTANPDTATTPEGTAVTIDVLDNDTDPDGAGDLDPASVTVTSGPTSGGTSVNTTTGEVTYTPNAGFTGSDGFDYEVCDYGGQCDTATVSVTVNANSPPVARDDDVTAYENWSIIIDVLANDNDPDGSDDIDTGSVTVVQNPDDGSVSVGSSGTILYTPDLDFIGTDTFEYEVCDEGGLCDTAEVTVTVEDYPEPPIASNDVASTSEDTAVEFSVVANDSDPDDNLDADTVSITAAPGNGSASHTGSGTVRYVPNANHNGSDSFVYQVCDTDDLCDTATVTVTITSINDLPVANDDAASTPENYPIPVNVLGNDTDVEDSLSPSAVSLTVPPSNGTALVNPVTGYINYAPSPHFFGTDQFVYMVCDTEGGCDTATVRVSVNSDGLNPPPSGTTSTGGTSPPAAPGDAGGASGTSSEEGDGSVSEAGAPGGRLAINQAPSDELAISGQEVTFHIVVRNVGQVPVESVTLTEDILDGGVVVSSTVQRGLISVSAASAQLRLGALAPEEEVAFQVITQVTGFEDDLMTGCATATGVGVEPVSLCNNVQISGAGTVPSGVASASEPGLAAGEEASAPDAEAVPYPRRPFGGTEANPQTLEGVAETRCVHAFGVTVTCFPVVRWGLALLGLGTLGWDIFMLWYRRKHKDFEQEAVIEALLD